MKSRIYHLKGFTLIELMIVIAIIGILAAIAYPSYTSSIRKSHRSDAQTTLLDIAAREERFFMDNNTYTATMGAGGLGLSSAATPAGYYTIAAAAGATGALASSFILTATALGDQVNDALCKNLTLTSTGSKGASGTSTSPATECW